MSKFVLRIGFSAITASALFTGMPELARADTAPAKVESKSKKATRTVKEELAEALLSMRVRVGILEHLKSDGLNVSVTVNNENVLLSGELDNAALRDLAVDVAKNTQGIKKVTSKLTIVDKTAGKPIATAVGVAEGKLNDSLLEARMKMKLLEENGKPALDVEVKATDGIVRLTGTVATEANRETLVATAKKVDGAKEVHDLLQVAK